MRQQWRFALSVLLLAGTAIMLEARNGAEQIPSRPALGSFPRSLAGWNSTDIALTQDVLDVLGPGDFLLRDYSDPEGRGSVALFIAYFPSQRAGDTIHSPKNCLPGAGWAPIRTGRITLNVPGHDPFEVNRYLIAKGEERQLVLYWYWAHDRALASEYAAKFYLVADAIRMHRTDGALIRLSVPLRPGESEVEAERNLTAWAGNVVPQLNTYIPR
ncbi:MAG TPA: EpsI family protein [Terriglobales bacterium]|jgi:EpsI family protein|nr:EpsI family protein [Terriglobales bacterium]